MPAIFDRVLPLNLIANTVIFYVAARLYLLPAVARLRPQQILVPILLLRDALPHFSSSPAPLEQLKLYIHPVRSFYFWILAVISLGSIQAADPISAREAKIDNVQLHYLTAGKGPAVLLLHGYAETSRMWRPLIPLLADKFTVIAPDLPGIGDSSIPDKIDMLSAAREIHELVRSLKIDTARVVGHDIGLMVAYAYATQFPNETEKLALMDAFLPGVPGWEPIYNAPNVWHFRFNGEYPEKLVKGRERIYFEYFWNVFAADKNHSIPETERKAYTEAYSKPGRMRAAWTYFASWPQLAQDFARLSQTKLTIPVLSIGGEKSLGKELGEQVKLVADNPTVIVLPNAGHWILEEKPKETTDALLKFLDFDGK